MRKQSRMDGSSAVYGSVSLSLSLFLLPSKQEILLKMDEDDDRLRGVCCWQARHYKKHHWSSKVLQFKRNISPNEWINECESQKTEADGKRAKNQTSFFLLSSNRAKRGTGDEGNLRKMVNKQRHMSSTVSRPNGFPLSLSLSDADFWRFSYFSVSRFSSKGKKGFRFERDVSACYSLKYIWIWKASKSEADVFWIRFSSFLRIIWCRSGCFIYSKRHLQRKKPIESHFKVVFWYTCSLWWLSS